MGILWLEFHQAKPWIKKQVKLIHPYLEKPGKKKMPQFVYKDQKRQGQDHLDNFYQYFHIINNLPTKFVPPSELPGVCPSIQIMWDQP